MNGRIEYERRDGDRDVHSAEKSLLKWILGMVSTLLVAAVVGAWQQSVQLAELRAQVVGLQWQVNALWQRIEREKQYRGGQNESGAP